MSHKEWPDLDENFPSVETLEALQELGSEAAVRSGLAGALRWMRCISAQRDYVTKALAAKDDKLQATKRALSETHRWIPVGEHMPEAGQLIVARFPPADRRSGAFYDAFHYQPKDDYYLFDLWQPLEAPK